MDGLGDRGSSAAFRRGGDGRGVPFLAKFARYVICLSRLTARRRLETLPAADHHDVKTRKTCALAKRKL